MGSCVGNRTINIKIAQGNVKTCTKPIKVEEKKEKKNITIKKGTLLTRSSWMNILDYMKFTELKEIGKVNRFFNSMTKSSDILIKFFQKKKDISSYYNESTSNFSSFLRNNSFCSFSDNIKQ